MGHCKLTARECLFSYELFQIQIREAVAESQLQRQGHCQKTKKKPKKSWIENSLLGSEDKNHDQFSVI